MTGKRDSRQRETFRFGGNVLAVALVLSALSAFCFGPNVHADTEAEDLGAQIPILLKILTFDRALEQQPQRDLLIVVLEMHSDTVSHRTAELLVHELSRYEGQRIWGRPLRAELRSYEDLMARFDSDVDAIYVAPGLEAHLSTILEWSRRSDSFTFSGVPGMRAKGVAVWLGGTPAAPRILINLPQLRAEGRELDARLLSLADVQR